MNPYQREARNHRRYQRKRIAEEVKLLNKEKHRKAQLAAEQQRRNDTSRWRRFG